MHGGFMTALDVPPHSKIARFSTAVSRAGHHQMGEREDSLASFEGEEIGPLFRDDGDQLDAVVISDLHLGSDNCQAKAAAAFLQDILDGTVATRRLIINGDVFDSIDFRRLKKTHWKVLSQIR